ncbi:MAG: lipopolysaccharide biosynthesis protein [Bacteroidota bacterium]
MSSRLASVAYSAAGLYSNHLLSFLTAAVLSRLLDPSDFGIVALLLLLNGFLGLFASAGVSSVVVQFGDLSKKDIHSLIGLCWFLGVLLAGISVMLSPFVATFFDTTALQKIIPVGSIAILLSPCSQVIDGILIRDNQFARRSLLSFSSALAASFIGISMAFSGYGYWALVVQIVARPFFSLFLGCLALKLLPLPYLDFRLYRKVGRYTIDLVGFRLLNYLTRNIDNLIIGRRLGLSELGYYSRAFALFDLTTNMLQSALGPVLHSSFQKTKDNYPALKIDVIRVISMVASMSFPVMGIASIYSEYLIFIIWGDGWNAAIFPFSVLAVVGMFRPIQAICGELLKTMDRTRELVFWGVFRLSIFTLAIIWGTYYGINGVAVAVLVASLINWMVFCGSVLAKHLKMSLSEMFLIFVPALKVVLLILPIAFLFKNYLYKDLSDLLNLIISTISLGALMVMIYKTFDNPVLQLIYQTIKKLRGMI